MKVCYSETGEVDAVWESEINLVNKSKIFAIEFSEFFYTGGTYGQNNLRYLTVELFYRLFECLSRFLLYYRN